MRASAAWRATAAHVRLVKLNEIVSVSLACLRLRYALTRFLHSLLMKTPTEHSSHAREGVGCLNAMGAALVALALVQHALLELLLAVTETRATRAVARVVAVTALMKPVLVAVTLAHALGPTAVGLGAVVGPWNVRLSGRAAAAAAVAAGPATDPAAHPLQQIVEPAVAGESRSYGSKTQQQ
eukprot:SAG25_NODE_1749_length_2399_cov_2.938696_1_plen_182_part_00